MGISDDRFKELLDGAPFGEDKEEFFERIDSELNKWFSESEYLGDIDAYLARTVRDVDSRIDRNIGSIQGLISVDTGPRDRDWETFV